MYAEERQREILVKARSAGRVEVETLSLGFEVSSETIRRDLTVLARAGYVQRVHGGAIPTERLTVEPTLALRDQLMTPEKEAIAVRAMAEVPAEGAILLDAGSTTRRLARILPNDRQLMVVTNALGIAMTLGHREDLTVLLLGGRLRSRTLATVDDWAVRAAHEIRVAVAFIGTNGLSTAAGLTTPDPAEAAIKRAMIANARRVVVLADHTKIGEEHFAKFGDLSDIDLLVTDTGLSDTATAKLTHAGLDVVRASTPQG